MFLVATQHVLPPEHNGSGFVRQWGKIFHDTHGAEQAAAPASLVGHAAIGWD